MKTFANATARDIRQAIQLSSDARQRRPRGRLCRRRQRFARPREGAHRRAGRHRQPEADPGADRVSPAGNGLAIGGLITLDALSRDPADATSVRGARRGSRERGDAPDQQRRHAGGQLVPASVVLVLPERFPVLQGGREPVLLGRRREPVSRDFRRRTKLYRPPVGYGAGAGRARRHIPHRGSVRRARVSRPPISSCCRSRTRPRRTSWRTTKS